MDLLEKLKRDLSIEGRTSETINLYLNISQKFLSRYKEINEDNIKNFLFELREDGFSDNYLRLTHYILRRLAKTDKKDINISPPKIEKINVKQPTFSYEEVKKLILNAKKVCNIQQKAILAVSTIWGLRKIEILRITKDDINKKENTIVIKTAKGGRPQVYTIPQPVKEFIYNYEWEPLSRTKIYALFNYILYICGFNLENYHRYGFHSIRRALITEMLRAGIDHYTVALWCRWKIPEFGMLPVYHQVAKGDLEERVYPKHPFLKLW